MRKFNEIIRERVRDKGYAQIELKDVVRAMGNKYKKLKDGDEIYSLMITIMDQLIDKKMKQGYSEVGEADITAMQDWADNHAPPPDYGFWIKKEDKKLAKKIMDAKGDKKALPQLAKDVKRWAMQSTRFIRDPEDVIKKMWKKG